MTCVLLDTSVYSLAMRGEDAALRVLQEAPELLLCPIVLGELYAGFAQGTQPQHNRSVLREFMSSPRVRIVALTADTSEFYALIHSQLKRAGTPVPTNDLWIAACAMEHGAAVATRDEHFRRIEGLNVLER
jgi:predicted nucleic acid-binding protein